MKVKVFAAFRWICVLLLSLDIVAWALFLAFDGVSQLDGSILFWGIIVLFLAVLPAGLLIWNIFTMENVIVFDTQGISRKRFGKIIKHFDWEEIQTISTTADNSFSGWIYISNELKSFNYSILSVTKMRLSKKVIYLHMSEKAKTALQTFAPEHLKDSIAKLWSQS